MRYVRKVSSACISCSGSAAIAVPACAVVAPNQGEGDDVITTSVFVVSSMWCLFRMPKIVRRLACEIRSVFDFSSAKNTNRVGIHRWICQAYGVNAMSGSMVRRKVRHFNELRDKENARFRECSNC